MTILTKNKKAIIFLISSIVWTFVIFSFSLQPASQSSAVSSGLLQKLSNFVYELTNIQIDISIVHNLFRKMAHFTEFFILGIFTTMYFKSINKNIYFAVLYGGLVALTDETIQFFTGSGRAMRFTDMLIDTAGVFTAVIIIYFICKIWKLKK